MNDDDLDLVFSEITGYLTGLPFKVLDNIVGGVPAFIIVSTMYGQEENIGFVSYGYTDGGWFGAYYPKSLLSPRRQYVRGALSWVLCQFIDDRIGLDSPNLT